VWGWSSSTRSVTPVDEILEQLDDTAPEPGVFDARERLGQARPSVVARKSET
jgi:hypothetical protein